MLCEVESNRFSDYLPLYQSGDATLGSDEYSQYDVYSVLVPARPLLWLFLGKATPADGLFTVYLFNSIYSRHGGSYRR